MPIWTLNYCVESLYVRPRDAYLVDPQGRYLPLQQIRLDRYTRFLRFPNDLHIGQLHIRPALESGQHGGHYRQTHWNQYVVPAVFKGLMLAHSVYAPSAHPLWLWNRGQVAARGLPIHSIAPLLEVNDPILTDALPIQIYAQGDVYGPQFQRTRVQPHMPGATYEQTCTDHRHTSPHSAHARLQEIRAASHIDMHRALAVWRDQRPELAVQAWERADWPVAQDSLLTESMSG